MKKGFTLIELLAVIVILAIIALIAIPIILGIINDARKESNERSVELYASAVRNAIASYQLTHPTAPKKFSDLNVQYVGEVECAKEELYKDGSFYIADCTVNETKVEYTYGIKKYEPQYYGDFNFSGTVGETAVPSNPALESPAGEVRYLGYDVTNGVVSAAYSCFVRNNTEYCLKGYDTNAFVTNNAILEYAFKDVENACFFDDGYSICDTGVMDANIDSSGRVSTYSDNLRCDVHDGGSFECYES